MFMEEEKEIIADLHIHSRFSRATSKNLDIINLVKYARIKGIDLLGTGDFTHNEWLQELKSNLKERDGLFWYKDGQGEFPFVLSSEISLIFSQDGKGRRVPGDPPSRIHSQVLPGADHAAEDGRSGGPGVGTGSGQRPGSNDGKVLRQAPREDRRIQQPRGDQRRDGPAWRVRCGRCCGHGYRPRLRREGQVLLPPGATAASAETGGGEEAGVSAHGTAEVPGQPERLRRLVRE